MQINCIAIDDDPVALMNIEQFIIVTPFLNLIATCESAFAALEVLDRNKVDLIFTDIDMPELNGMEFVKSLLNRPKVVFTTSYTEFAVEGFKVDAIDYLVKPFDYSQFLNAANKAKKNIGSIGLENKVQSENNDHIFVKSDYMVIKVRFDDIKYIQGMHEYVQIHFLNQKPIMTLISLKKLGEQLPGNKFMRVHKSYIVNLNHITTIERNKIVYQDNVRIPVGESFKKKFQEFIDKKFLG